MTKLNIRWKFKTVFKPSLVGCSRTVRLIFDFFEMNSANLPGNLGRYGTVNKIKIVTLKTWERLFIKNTGRGKLAKGSTHV